MLGVFLQGSIHILKCCDTHYPLLHCSCAADNIGSRGISPGAQAQGLQAQAQRCTLAALAHAAWPVAGPARPAAAARTLQCASSGRRLSPGSRRCCSCQRRQPESGCAMSSSAV